MTTMSEDSDLKQAAREAFTELLEAAAAAANIPVQSQDRMHLAIACWSLVHGYTTLLTKRALDFVEPDPGMETVVRFIELDTRRW